MVFVCTQKSPRKFVNVYIKHMSLSLNYVFYLKGGGVMELSFIIFNIRRIQLVILLFLLRM